MATEQVTDGFYLYRKLTPETLRTLEDMGFELYVSLSKFSGIHVVEPTFFNQTIKVRALPWQQTK